MRLLPVQLQMCRRLHEVVPVLRRVLRQVWAGVAEAGNVSAKLYQLFSIIREEGKYETTEGFIQCLQSLPLEVVSKRTIKPPWTELGTVLQQAVNSQKIDFVRCLLELGADPTVTTQAEEKSPMGLAIELNQDPKVLHLLKQFVT